MAGLVWSLLFLALAIWYLVWVISTTQRSRQRFDMLLARIDAGRECLDIAREVLKQETQALSLAKEFAEARERGDEDRCAELLGRLEEKQLILDTLIATFEDRRKGMGGGT